MLKLWLHGTCQQVGYVLENILSSSNSISKTAGLGGGAQRSLICVFVLAICVDVTVNLHGNSILEQQWPLSAGLCVFPGCKKGSGTQQRARGAESASIFPRLQSNRAWVWSMADSPGNSQDLKDQPLTSWCQIPHHTFRGGLHASTGQAIWWLDIHVSMS